MNFTSTLSPTLVNEARYGIAYGKNEVNPPWLSSDADVRKGAADWLLQGGKNATTGALYPISLTPGAGNFAFANTMINNTSTGAGAFTFSGSNSPLFTYGDTLSWSRGHHGFKMGGELRPTRSTGYSGSVFPTVTGGTGGNASALANPILPALPNQLATNRTNAANMLYFLAGSLNSASMLYWVASDEDVKNGTWQDYVTAQKRYRTQVQNEWDAFFKDDWKLLPSLTLNLGLRYEFYGSPYVRGGYTAAAVGQGAGLFGVGRSSGSLFDNWLQPGNIYLSGYGPNVSSASALQCTQGSAQNSLLPSPNCDPNKLTKIEFVGADSDNPDKTVIRNDRNNFGPAVGFAWQVPWFGKGQTSVRGGVQITYGGAGRNAATIENRIANIPGSSSTATTVLGDFLNLTTNRALQLSDLTALVPVRPTSPAKPGGQVPIFDRATTFTAYDPNYATPYTENFTLSVTRSVGRKVTVDVRYIGVMGKKREGNLNLNLPNVYFNKELWDALESTRRGEDAPLFDQMFAGLDLHGTTGTGYGAIGTVVGGVLQHGSAHLRRNSTFTANLANGNFDAVASTLNTISTGVTGLEPLPTGLTGVSGRVLRNGCDRLAAGLTNIPTQCFPENYIVANPQLGTATYISNLGSSNYHSMQAQFNLRSFHGISFQTTYTWAKTLGLVPQNYTNPLDRRADYAPPYQAVKHDIRTNGTFELPIGPNKLLFPNSSGWVARLVERWQASVILNASSGNPRTIIGAHMFYATGNQNLDSAQNRVDVVSPLFDLNMRGHAVWDGPNRDTGTYYGSKLVTTADPQCQLTNKTDSMGFNLFSNCTLNAIALKNSDGSVGPIMLQNPLPGHRGNMPFSLEAPGKWKFDANLGKTFRLTETKTLQVRFDATNVLNHPDLADPQPQTGQSINTTGVVFGQLPTKGGSGSGNAPRAFNAQLRLSF